MVSWDLARPAGAERRKGPDFERLAQELDVPVGKEEVPAAGMEAVWFVVVSLVHNRGAVYPAPLCRSVRGRPVQAERTFIVRPPDPLVVGQGRVGRPPAVDDWPTGRLDHHDGRGGPVGD